MSSLSWKLRRLRAMSAREVATRLVRAVRERVSPLPKEPPEATWRRHYAAHTPLPTVQRIADAIRKLAENPELRMQMGMAARKRVEPLDIQNYRVRLGEIYREAFESANRK